MKGSTSWGFRQKGSMGKSHLQLVQREKAGVKSTKDHLPKGTEPRGPKIKGWFLGTQVLSSAGEFWGFLIWKGEILFERKYGQNMGTKVMTERLRGRVYSKLEQKSG